MGKWEKSKMILWAIKALVLYGWQDVTLHTVTLMIQWHLFGLLPIGQLDFFALIRYTR